MIEIKVENGGNVQVTDKPIYNTLVMGDMVQHKVVNLADAAAAEGQAADAGTGHDDERLQNIIFSDRLFDTDARLAALRAAIASYIDMGQRNGTLAPAATDQIDPSAQNEWYYILLAVTEAGVASRVHIGDVTFAEQMISWFPWLFQSVADVEATDFKRKFTKSISAERSLWKYGEKRQVTAIQDMWARQRILGIDHAKLARLHAVALGLRTALKQLIIENS